ncbi:RHS repeat-associated core domain-containing protein [uncultured Dokdonia sp.]|uniref:RHS repeat-associated core domain-containing protein n=1 Tax=uncultured Dokdonia sp. TaxID=575653 RepID=UPI002607F366|nr:RHS repeat-associated core domain-containing protein [uncultured Dokdonia sp.]
MDVSYYPFGLQHSGYNDVVTSNKNNVAERFMFNGKENNPELGLDWYDFGARNYDPSLGRWMNIDPLAETFPNLTPYNYAVNNPILFIDPDGRLASPIYDQGGNLLGTDDQGLQGEAIIMNADNFEQGMSHEEALDNSLGTEGLNSEEAYDKLSESYLSLKDRPDYDGELTMSEANDWFNNRNGRTTIC